MDSQEKLNYSLKGKKVIILGGSSGLGFAAAKAADAEGAQVIIVSSNQKNIDKALLELSAGSAGFVVNLRDEQSIKAFFTETGNFDHLIYTAAENIHFSNIGDTDINFAKSFFDLRFWGAFTAVKYAAPFINTGGSISLTSGSAASRPGPGWSLMVSILNAIEGFVRAMAVELAPIRVNSIAPGVTKTDLWNSMSEAEKENLYKTVGASLPLQRVGEPEDIALAFVYLMKQQFGTGQNILVDGGTVLV